MRQHGSQDPREGGPNFDAPSPGAIHATTGRGPIGTRHSRKGRSRPCRFAVVQAGWRQASVFSVGRLGLALCTEQGGRPHAAARERRCADPDCRARARGLHAFGEWLQTNLRPSRFVTRPSLSSLHTPSVTVQVRPSRRYALASFRFVDDRAGGLARRAAAQQQRRTASPPPRGVSRRRHVRRVKLARERGA